MINFSNRYRSGPPTQSRKITAGATGTKRLSDSQVYQEKDSQRIAALAKQAGLSSTSDAIPSVTQMPLNIDTDPLMEGMDYD